MCLGCHKENAMGAWNWIGRTTSNRLEETFVSIQSKRRIESGSTQTCKGNHWSIDMAATLRTGWCHVRTHANAWTVAKNRRKHPCRSAKCMAANLPDRPTKTGLKKLKIAELQDVLTREGLDTQGKKDVLVNRLLEHLASKEEPSKDASKKASDGTEVKTGRNASQASHKEVFPGRQTPAHADALADAFRNASASARSEVDVEASSVEDADVERANALAVESTSKLQEALDELDAARQKEAQAMERVEALEAQLQALREKAESMVDVNSALTDEMETLQTQIRTTDEAMERSTQAQTDPFVVPRVVGAGLGAFGSAFVSAFRRTAMEASSLGNQEWRRSPSTDSTSALPPDTKRE